MKRAVFLDKDGTLVDNSGYPKIIPGHDLLEYNVVEGLRYLKEKGYKLIIVSNQPWIAKKIMTEEEVENVFRKLNEKLEEGLF